MLPFFEISAAVYLELAEGWLVSDLGFFQQDTDDESGMLVWKDGVGRLD